MKRMNILGLNFDCLSYADMFLLFDDWLSNKSSRSHRLVLGNVDVCVSSLFSKNLRSILNSADLVGIDGMPFLMWARAFYHKNSDRFYAPDLMLEVSKKAKEKGYTFYLFGGYPGAGEKIEAYLNQRFDGINIVGKYSPPFRILTDEEDNEMIRRINDAHPDYLWVGLGSPKQDIWIHEHIDKIRGAIIIPSGATFDFFSGKIRQAPNWIRSLGFEWLFRLTQDFRRLWVRYTIYNIIFIFVFLSQLVKIISYDQEGYLYFLGHKTEF
jgi:N-acetylglucosaminyldiphosphoundecaprenol N-acetyl-beta-D-mannosaminyltransferase